MDTRHNRVHLEQRHRSRGIKLGALVRRGAWAKAPSRRFVAIRTALLSRAREDKASEFVSAGIQ
eukprot:scaffold297329_cov27-Tisochrysis_lutea.AAC.5